LYNIPKDKIKVIHLGNPFEDIQPHKVEYLPNKYLLFVGNRGGYKNFINFIESLVPILKKDTDLLVVCAGGGKFTNNEKQLFSKLKIESQVKHIKFKNDNELAFIYKKAHIYILPSLYEGFGLTALEAFSMDCPVVASNVSSIPEVCGDAAIFINPKSEDSIRKGVARVLEDEKLRKNLIKLGFERIKKFTWRKTVKETLRVYERAIKSYN